MKTTIQNIFKDYNNVQINHNGYQDIWYAIIEGNLKTETIMEMVAAGYQFEVQPWGANTLRIKFE